MFPYFRFRVFSLLTFVFLILFSFGSRAEQFSGPSSPDLYQAVFNKVPAFFSGSTTGLNTKSHSLSISRNEIGSSHRIKLERKRRKIIEGTPEILNPQPGLMICCETRSVLFPLVSRTTQSVFFLDLIRGPPYFS